MIAPYRDVALAPLSTFRVPATARQVYDLADAAALDAALAALAAAPRATAMRPFVLGGGSNVLFARDLDEPVLRMRLRGRRLIEDDGRDLIVEFGAGEVWNDVVDWTLAQGWFGLEYLTLIPGLVGAAPWQYIGAYGVEVGERIVAVDAVHLADGRRRRFVAADCAFGYRSSAFKTAAGRDWLIVAVQLRLSRTPALRTGYGEIGDELRGSGDAAVTPRAVADAIAAIRRRKLPDPALVGNAGSFFHNPIVGRATVDALRDAHPAMPVYPVAGDAGQAKLSAGWLIEAAGWKGHRDGDAGVSAQHALVLVNHGTATGREILALARRIQASVQARFGIALVPEPIIIE
ncbi:MAG: UDP-N-acetylmuramate dehydrogenase [Lautropia sp.]